ncbi:protein phosphatase 2C domain-containing protein [Streptomyces sp. Da 82-17]|uniref:protein phosphatase 2C domain-containing protein n=1 Tax=Streptomyces sp. Da 82-17 TaxID=3377116 RepID=UPI0038D4B8C1
MTVPAGRRPAGTPARAARAEAAAAAAPWPRIELGTPGPEFEPRPPGQYGFDFPDTECDGWSTAGPAGLSLRFASVRGAKHRYYGQPRQDAARASVHTDSGCVVFAVADGVSSAASSELGAVEACRAAVERMLHLLSEGGRAEAESSAHGAVGEGRWESTAHGVGGPRRESTAHGTGAPHRESTAHTESTALDFRDVARHAAERLRQLAQWRLSRKQPDVREVAGLYATTLVAGCVRPEPGGAVAELFRVGDSGAWVLDTATGRYRELFGSKTDPDTLLVSNDVTPLPHVPDPLEQRTVRLGAPHVLLAGTDGFADPLGDGDGQVGALFARHLAAPPAPPWLAHLLDFSRETFDDDRTLLALWPYAPGGSR